MAEDLHLMVMTVHENMWAARGRHDAAVVDEARASQRPLTNISRARREGLPDNVQLRPVSAARRLWRIVLGGELCGLQASNGLSRKRAGSMRAVIDV